MGGEIFYQRIAENGRGGENTRVPVLSPVLSHFTGSKKRRQFRNIALQHRVNHSIHHRRPFSSERERERERASLRVRNVYACAVSADAS